LSLACGIGGLFLDTICEILARVFAEVRDELEFAAEVGNKLAFDVGAIVEGLGVGLCFVAGVKVTDRVRAPSQRGQGTVAVLFTPAMSGIK
jgi:hypothetical protein